MVRKISEVKSNTHAAMECKEGDLRLKTLSSKAVVPISAFRKKLPIIGRVYGVSFEMLEEKRKVTLSRRFRKDAFLVEIEKMYLVLAPADTLKESFYVALIDCSSNFHLALCEKGRKKDCWVFRSADTGRKLKLSSTLILGKVLAFEEPQTKVPNGGTAKTLPTDIQKIRDRSVFS
ncbi:MAG: hypothetical protein IJD43_14100 [Thermoguttaceae bacterium]|nr:hypothetical protein [Thermoguttaceae bacterium]